MLITDATGRFLPTLFTRFLDEQSSGEFGFKRSVISDVVVRSKSSLRI
jgi:hypothetical protein